MVSKWTDHLELCRYPGAKFAVSSGKCGEDPATGRRRWLDEVTDKGLRSPGAVRQALLRHADSLRVELDWNDVVTRIAKIDWVTAAVIARQTSVALPSLPAAKEVMAQRTLRPFGKVTVGAAWGYDLHCLTMSFEQWVRILTGERFERPRPYYYEGKRFRAWWIFDGKGRLNVAIDMDGSGCGSGDGWLGAVGGVNLLEGPQVDGEDLAKLALAAVPAP